MIAFGSTNDSASPHPSAPKVSEEAAKRLLLWLEESTRVAALTDRDLAQEFLLKVWAKSSLATKEEAIIDEVLSRFERLAGIARDEASGEIVAGGEGKS